MNVESNDINCQLRAILERGYFTAGDVLYLRGLLKKRCYRLLEEARRAGEVVKAEACEICGKSATYAHHYSYFEPLDVIWLCNACHGKVHTYGYEDNLEDLRLRSGQRLGAKPGSLAGIRAVTGEEAQRRINAAIRAKGHPVYYTIANMTEADYLNSISACGGC